MPSYFQKFKTTSERFWEKIDRTGGPKACWPYKEAKRKECGYGAFWLKGKIVNAHRVAWELTRGKITNGLHCLHRCDNTMCCNPKHLWLGTNGDNVNDKVKKGRQSRGKKHSEAKLPTAVRGERHPQAKLSIPEIKSIRIMRKAGQKLVDIARLFGVSHVAIGNICSGKVWKHVK